MNNNETARVGKREFRETQGIAGARTFLVQDQNEPLNCVFGFHGTRGNSPEDVIASGGVRMSQRAGKYGRAIYASEKPEFGYEHTVTTSEENTVFHVGERVFLILALPAKHAETTDYNPPASAWNVDLRRDRLDCDLLIVGGRGPRWYISYTPKASVVGFVVFPPAPKISQTTLCPASVADLDAEFASGTREYTYTCCHNGTTETYTTHNTTVIIRVGNA
jgi:hypothetical protein